VPSLERQNRGVYLGRALAPFVQGGRTTRRSSCKEEAPRKRDHTRGRIIATENTVGGGTILPKTTAEEVVKS